jgi:SAM-dependent methyltransferase
MSGPLQTDVDARIQEYYSVQFTEAERLTVRSAQGRLEFERTQELVRAKAPAGARILDIGGATGIHAAPLAAIGHDVVLLDPVPSHVASAAAHGTFEALLGDARDLPFPDRSFDIALVFGPLYHLAARSDRLLALREAARVVRPGGWVFAAAIPRFTRYAMLSLGVRPSHPYPPEWVALLEHGLPAGNGRFPGGHFHTGEELADELIDAGLGDVTVCAIEGPAGPGLELLPETSEEVHQAALTLVRAVGHLPGIRDISNHIMGMGTVN